MDGVLVHSAPVHYGAYRAVLARRGRKLSAAEYGAMFGRSREQVFRALLGELPAGELATLMQEKEEEVVRILETTALEPIPGAIELAVAASEAGLRIAVATSSRTPWLFLRAIGAEAVFSVVVDRTMVDRPKPEPDVFLRAAALVGVDPERCVVIEDSPLGLRAAKAAGCVAIGLTTSRSAEELCDADRVVDSFSELTDLLPG